MISRTAAHMAAFRALESAMPADSRLFEDQYAKRFLRAWERVLVELARLPLVRRLLELYADRRAPGARSSGIARTRLIDDWISAECEEGAEQVVLLGAGYDCRALRLSALARVRVFELDRRELLAHKTSRLGAPPPNLTRTAIDFRTEDMKERLLSAGYAPAKPSVFVWEGVANYLDDRSAAAVLDCVAALRARIIFTYVHADAIAGTFDAPGLASLSRRLERIGEPWTFGLDPQALAQYLRAHGLRRRADLGAREYRALYRRGEPQEREGYEFYRVALAEPL
jgi:methyltransferase (TIGR00027 family)